MRRMLDPKEAGGSTPARHAYRITIGYDCWFLSFSTKDYGFKIGKENPRPSDFFTNDSYKDLLSEGIHPAGGYYNGDSNDLLMSNINILPTKILARGYSPSLKDTSGGQINIQNKIIYIIQLF